MHQMNDQNEIGLSFASNNNQGEASNHILMFATKVGAQRQLHNILYCRDQNEKINSLNRCYNSG